MDDSKNYFIKLKNKQIINILIGDTKFNIYNFDDGTNIPISMPYLSGPEICKISNKFGLCIDYLYSANSRWEYLYQLLDFCIITDSCSDLLEYLFRKSQFQKILAGHKAEEIKEAYEYIKKHILDEINGLLYFEDVELTIIENKFIIKPINNAIYVKSTKITQVDREYIASIAKRALEDIESHNYDSAITKSRTLLEETFCYVIELKNISPPNDGNITKLYKTVRNLYNMHTDKEADKRINSLLSGLNSIVSSIAEMRNNDSDSHGVGSKRIRLQEHHARLLVNSAVTMSDFILSVGLNAKHD